MRIVVIVSCLMILGITFLWYKSQNDLSDLQDKYEQEKVFFDARFGEIVRLQDDIGAYQDSCWLYRRNLRRMEDSLVKYK